MPDPATMMRPALGEPIVPARFHPGRQRSRLRVCDRTGRDLRDVFVCDHLIEAPNWTPDGRWLVVNSGGALYRLRADGTSAPQRIATGAHAPANNDHVLAPDGRTLYFSTDDGHLMAAPLAGGTARRVSNVDASPTACHCYLHGVSPDGQWLAYVGLRPGATAHAPAAYELGLLPSMGGADRTLLRPGVPVDGPEFSPDGTWLYFNGEIGADRPGHSQLFRLRLADGTIEQLTDDERVNWFPHLSPNGRWMLWLSYPPGTLGHPANLTVRLRIGDPLGHDAVDIVELFGGQGTVNVNSWAPDSEHFAFVDYPAI